MKKQGLKLLFIFLIPLSFCSPRTEEQKENQGLGLISFETTGSQEAQEEFIKGVLSLHSFFYPEAKKSFKKAREIDPDFVMAYWGEAMSLNKTFWQIQDKDEALEILNSLGNGPEEWVNRTSDPKEQKFLMSLGILYGDNKDKLERDRDYMEFMETFSKEFPEDDEIKAFYTLSLLGILRDNQGNEKVRMKAGALAQEILDHNPDHPGALHYLIHSMDDPTHARLALKAADRYSEVAPKAHHARHMPSHIYVQLGYWDKVISSNISAWESSVAWADREGLPVTSYDDHSLAWMNYGYEQRGQFDKALENLKTIQKNNSDTNTYRSQHYEALMLCRLWTEASNTDSLALNAEFTKLRGQAKISWEFTKGWLGLRRGDIEKCELALSNLNELISDFESKDKLFLMAQARIHQETLNGLRGYYSEDEESFESYFDNAASMEEELNPPTGPPDMIKPVHELYGELLLEQGKIEKAHSNFLIQLERTPNRSPSQLGIARCYLNLGDLEKAKDHFEKFASSYSESKEHPYFLEAKEFLLAHPDSVLELKSISYSYTQPQVYYDQKLRITDCPVPIEN